MAMTLVGRGIMDITLHNGGSLSRVSSRHSQLKRMFTVGKMTITSRLHIYKSVSRAAQTSRYISESECQFLLQRAITDYIVSLLLYRMQASQPQLHRQVASEAS